MFKALFHFVGLLAEHAFLLFPTLWSLIHPFKALRERQLQSVLDNLINKIIQQRKSKDSDDRNDLLTLLLRAQDPESKYRLSDKEVRDEILTFLIGGFETTTSQLCWILYHLGEYRSR